jgi:hypothetical protein
VNTESVNTSVEETTESSAENTVTPSVLDGLDALFDAAKTIDFNPHNSVNTMRKTAIELGGLRFKVFPIHFLRQRPFSGVWECSCCEWERWRAKKEGDPNREIACSNSPGKHPRSKWKETATDDADVIKELWSDRHKGANIAIATGQPSGVYVIDLDGKVGMDSLRALEAKHGALPPTMMAFSGRGDGLHLYFKTPAEEEGLTISAGTIGTGIDTRGTGGFIVAPGSNHNSLRRYMWVPGYGPDEIKPADLPAWFIEAMRQASNKTAEDKAAAKAAKAANGGNAPNAEKREASDPFDVFAMASDDMLAGGWVIKDGEELDGVDAYISRIGEESEGYAGFHAPIYSALCSFYQTNGLDASDDEAKALLVPAILNAPCKDGRNAKRYAKDRYLDERIADAREFIGKAREEEAARALQVGERVEEIVARFTKATPEHEFVRVYKMIAASKLPPGQVSEIAAKIAKLIGSTVLKVTTKIDGYRTRAAEEAASKKERAKREQEADDILAGKKKPILDPSKDDFDYMVDACKVRLKSMNGANSGVSMRFFNVGDKMTRLTFPNENGRQFTELMDKEVMWSELNTAVRWEKDSQVIEAPRGVAAELVTQWGFTFPPLKGIAASPVFDADGALIATPGYHAKSGIFYNPPKDFVLPSIPEHVTRAEAFKARDLILDHVIPDFPFSDGKEEGDMGDASRSHAVALLLQQFMRPMIGGNLPITFAQKPEAGTGATLLIQMLLYIAHGRIISAQTETKDTEELRKQLTAAGMESEPVVWIDNINSHVHGAALANWATCGVWEDRILGRTQKARFPVTCTTVLSGNNMRTTGEIARRCVPIFLDAMRDPKQRTSFKHDLERYVPANRAELVRACLVMIKYWVQQGKPMWRGKVLPSFAGYSRTMGGLLKCLEIPGFLENRHVMTNSADSDDEDWPALLATWADHFGGDPVIAARIYDLIVDKGLNIKVKGDTPADLAAALGTRMAHKVRQVFHAPDGRSFRLISVTQETGKRGTDNKGLWRVKQMIDDPFTLAAEDLLEGLTEEDWADVMEAGDEGLFQEPGELGGLTDEDWRHVMEDSFSRKKN